MDSISIVKVDNFSDKELSIMHITSTVGTIAGLGYAFHKKMGFWGYAGFALLGGFVGGMVGDLYANATKK